LPLGVGSSKAVLNITTKLFFPCSVICNHLFVGVCINMSGSPLSESVVGKLTKEKLGAFTEFFVSGNLQTDVLYR